MMKDNPNLTVLLRPNGLADFQPNRLNEGEEGGQETLPTIAILNPRDRAILDGPQHGRAFNVSGSVWVPSVNNPIEESDITVTIEGGNSGHPSIASERENHIIRWEFNGVAHTPGLLTITAELRISNDLIDDTSVSITCPDTVPPTVLVLSPINGATIPIAESGTDIEVQIIAEDPLGISSVEAAFVGEPSLKKELGLISGNNNSGIWSGKLRCSANPLGLRRINLHAVDLAGNPKDEGLEFIAKDSTPPAGRILTPLENARFMLPSGVANAAITVRVTAHDLQSGLKSILYDLKNGAGISVEQMEIGNLAGIPSINHEHTLTARAPGTFWVRVLFTDMADNVSAIESRIEVLRRIIPLNADDLIGPREYLRALVNFVQNHVKVSDTGSFVDASTLQTKFGQNFTELSESLALSGVIPINQARLCVEILRAQLGSEGVDTAPTAEYLLAAYQFLLRQLGTSHEEIRLMRGADMQKKKELATRLGFGNESGNLDKLFLNEGVDLTEEVLHGRFGLVSTNAKATLPASAGGSEFFAWQSSQQQEAWAVTDRTVSYALIDPDVIGKADLAGSTSDVQFVLWSQRKTQLEQREAALRALLNSPQNTTCLEVFNSLLADIYRQWAPPEKVLTQLENLLNRGLESGQRIDAELAALGLNMAALRRLQCIGSLAKAASNRSDVTEAEFEDVIAILVRVWKLRQLGAWRKEESDAGISISPKFFKLYLDEPPTLPNTGFKDGVPIAKGSDSVGWTVMLPGETQPKTPKVTDRQPYPQWMPNDDRSHWINSTGDGTESLPAGEYVYTTQIDLAGWDLSSIELVARVAVDNSLAAITIKSPDTPGQENRMSLGLGTNSAFTAVAIDTSNLFPGLNDIAFHVVNAGRRSNPTGLRVEFLFAKPPIRTRSAPWRLVAPVILPLNVPTPSTGHADMEAGAADPYWQITAAPAGAPAPGLAVVSSNMPRSWLANNQSKDSRWISPVANANAALPPGEYVYETVFDLTGWDLTSMALKLRVAVDNELSAVHVRTPSGRLTALGAASGHGSFITIVVDGSALEAGCNTFEFRVQNWASGNNPTGLRVEFVYDVPPCQPGQSWQSGILIRDDWQSKLAARIDLITTREQAAAAVIQATEQTTLPLLRDSLINRYAKLKFLAPSEAAEELGQRFLIETRGDAWRVTTRVQQASESLQTLVQALRDNSFNSGHPAQDWSIAMGQNSSDTQNQFDEEWYWMGNYEAWRSATLIFYYPENLLLPGLRPVNEQTKAFQTLLQTLRAKSRITRASAQALAKTYLEEVKLHVVLPPGVLLLSDHYTELQLEQFRIAMSSIWHGNSDVDMRKLLDEILYAAPMAIALQLQKTGEFEAALDWYRSVYAYDLPTDDLRKIFPGLSEEHNEAPVLNQGTHWLCETLDPHSFAQQRWFLDPSGNAPSYKRANPYTRFTMMCVTRCLIEYGDAEFTRDTGESLANARGLYLVARNILRRPDFDQVQPTNSDQVLLPNPILESLRARVSNQLRKMRQGRNVAGMKRDIELPTHPTTLTGVPSAGSGGQLVVQRGNRNTKPTPYRFAVLMDRAKQLVSIAQQMEGAYLSALEKTEGESYNLKKAGFDLNLAAAGVSLQRLRVTEAKASKTLSEKQKSRAIKQKQTYDSWISVGLNQYESSVLQNYQTAADSRQNVILADGAITSMQALTTAATATTPWSNVAANSFAAGITATAIGKTIFAQAEAAAESAAQISNLMASFERRSNDWQLASELADIDEQIGEQQIQIASDHIAVTTQEQAIAEIQNSQASDMAKFLATKFFNVELYEWMSGVLGGVYSYFLQQATSIAALAQQQLGFERQESPGYIIQDDYWEVPAEPGQVSKEGSSTDRRGLTGSARLLQDIYQLDQFAFETNKRKLNVMHTLSLSRLDPYAFSVFRESGLLNFTTTMALFDEAFPGHYLRLIKRVRTSVVALIPPISGIRATLTASGISKVVTGGDVFQEITIRRDPESVALSSPMNATGVFELDAQTELLMPFESMGVATSWEFSMPKAANAFDFDTIADVLITIEYTALTSEVYRRQVIQQLPTRVSTDKPYSIRDDFPDLWYELSNYIPGSTLPEISFRSERQHFPPNLQSLTIAHLLFALITEPMEAAIEANIEGSFTPDGGTAKALISTTLVDRRISTRLASGIVWSNVINDLPAVGSWQFTLPSSVVDAIADGTIQDILIVQTFTGVKPAWPVS